MSDFLFDVPEVKSPRLLWLERHGITARQWSPKEFDYLGGVQFVWGAEGGGQFGHGDTEDEAITQLALKLGIKLWNEETKLGCDRCFGNRAIDRPALHDYDLPRYGSCPKCNYDGKGGQP